MKNDRNTMTMAVAGTVMAAAVFAAGAQPSFRLLDEDPAVAGSGPFIMAMSRDGSSFGGIAWDGEVKGFTLTGATLRFLNRPDFGPEGQLSVLDVATGGAFACGLVRDDSDGYRGSAVRWGPDGIGQDLGVLGGDEIREASAHAISEDGQTVVGYSSADDGWQAFRWTESGGMVGLGDLQPSPAQHPRSSFATGVSADGATVVGYASNGVRYSLFRWTAGTGMVDLDPNGEWSINHLASGGGVHAMTGGIQYPDGSDRDRAFRWTDNAGIEAIDDLSGVQQSYGWAISDDGRVAVGDYWLDLSSGARGFLWTSEDGMTDLAAHVETNTGFDQTGWTLQPWAVSGDGRIVAGIATYSGPGPVRQSSFIYELEASCPADFNSDGQLDFFDFDAFLAAFQAQDSASDLNGDALFTFHDLAQFIAAFNAGCP